MRKLLRLVNDSTAQALPLALVALALGSLLVSPFLVNASVNLLASRQVDSSIKDYYSADAGVEWALWRLKDDPTLTTSTVLHRGAAPAHAGGDQRLQLPEDGDPLRAGSRHGGEHHARLAEWRRGEVLRRSRHRRQGRIFAMVDVRGEPGMDHPPHRIQTPARGRWT